MAMEDTNAPSTDRKRKLESSQDSLTDTEKDSLHSRSQQKDCAKQDPLAAAAVSNNDQQQQPDESNSDAERRRLEEKRAYSKSNISLFSSKVEGNFKFDTQGHGVEDMRPTIAPPSKASPLTPRRWIVTTAVM
jgi:hypothetical protein